MIADLQAAPIKGILLHSEPVHSMLKLKGNSLRNYYIPKLQNMTNMGIKLFSPRSPLCSLNVCLSDMSIFSDLIISNMPFALDPWN